MTTWLSIKTSYWHKSQIGEVPKDFTWKNINSEIYYMLDITKCYVYENSNNTHQGPGRQKDIYAHNKDGETEAWSGWITVQSHTAISIGTSCPQKHSGYRASF
jgi:hypothetical protein